MATIAAANRRAVRCVAAEKDVAGRHVREQRHVVGGIPPGCIQEEARVVGDPAPDPRKIGRRDMCQHERRPRVPRSQHQRVPAKRGDAKPRMDDHRQSTLGGGGHDCVHAAVAQIEAFRARVELHPARAGRVAAFQLRYRALPGIDAAEWHQPAFGRCSGGDDRGVGFPVAARLHQRERDRLCVGQTQSTQEIGQGKARAVGVVVTQVGVGVEELQARKTCGEPAKQGQ